MLLSWFCLSRRLLLLWLANTSRLAGKGNEYNIISRSSVILLSSVSVDSALHYCMNNIVNQAIHGGTNRVVAEATNPVRGRPGIDLDRLQNPPPVTCGLGLALVLIVLVIDIALLIVFITRLVQTLT
jgi:hypothetical protein